MRRLLLTLALLAFAAPAIAPSAVGQDVVSSDPQTVKRFKWAAEPRASLGSRVRHDGGGTYVMLVDPASSDTLTVWLQGALEDRAPDYARADMADAVIWCYPERHPHASHVLPEAKGEIMVVTSREEVWVLATENFGEDTLRYFAGRGEAMRLR